MKRILLSLVLVLATSSIAATATAALPITIVYSNVVINKTAISTSQSINVTFDMRSTGVPAGLQPTVFLELADQSAECEEECGSSVVKQVSGSISQGKWAASITAGSGLPSGTYRVVIFIPKLKGINGALYYDNRSVILTNSSTPKNPSADPNKKNPTESVKATPKPTQSVVSTIKASTITCTKGKLTKKVTAVKPKCPSGYKVKK